MTDQQNDIQTTVHHLDRSVGDLDRRVLVLEERSKSQEAATKKLHDNMSELHEDVRQNNKMVTTLSNKIDKHRTEDNEQQKKTLRYIIATLISVISGIALTIIRTQLS